MFQGSVIAFEVRYRQRNHQKEAVKGKQAWRITEDVGLPYSEWHFIFHDVQPPPMFSLVSWLEHTSGFQIFQVIEKHTFTFVFKIIHRKCFSTSNY